MKITLEKILDDLDSIPLSVSQLKIIANCNSFLSFEDLLKYNSFEHLFTSLGNEILIIIKSTKNYGHFAVLFKHSKNKCIFYDSYGLKFEDILKNFSYTSKIIQGINPLKKLESSSNIKCEMNTFTHQDKHSRYNEINTCGFHCANRIRYNFLNNSEYNDFMNSTKIKHDDFVILTNLNVALDINII